MCLTLFFYILAKIVLLRIINILFILFCIVSYNTTQAQCNVIVPSSTLQHINCPNGGAVGGASILQNNYLNYSWKNLTNGLLYGGASGGTSRTDLDAGIYQITASTPYNSSCPAVKYSSLFEILEAEANFDFSPTQACPALCDVLVSASMLFSITGVSYSYQFDSNPILSFPNTSPNQCGGPHTYEIIADGLYCGVENIGISQFAQMNLATSSIDASCLLLGSSTVSITGVGASGLSTYCTSTPQMAFNHTIDDVSILGDITNISNNTNGSCDMYEDYTSMSADVTPGFTYTLNIDIGTCNTTGSAQGDHISKVYIDWNIDGDFDDLNELVAQVGATPSPYSHMFSIAVPLDAIPGQSRMRIVLQDTYLSNLAGPCDDGVTYFGSTEDYTIQVNGSVAYPVDYLWSDGQITATATNLGAGTYTVTITDANLCTSTATSVINGPANVSVIAGADQLICNGGVPANLTATGNSIGGSYAWSPSSAFTNPNLQNPSFNSGVNTNTVYTVTFTDATSGCIATDYVTITTNSVPSVTLSALPNPACEGEDIILTANPSISVSQYKFQYSNNGGVNWTNVTTPVWDINNPITYNNITQSTDFRVRVREDIGCNTSSWSSAITVPVSIFNPILIYHN